MDSKLFWGLSCLIVLNGLLLEGVGIHWIAGIAGYVNGWTLKGILSVVGCVGLGLFGLYWFQNNLIYITFSERRPRVSSARPALEGLF
jgi:hypothetical protein